jgi:hypothetical protein
VYVIINSGVLQESGTPRTFSVKAYTSSWAFAKVTYWDIINTVSWRTEYTFINVTLRTWSLGHSNPDLLYVSLFTPSKTINLGRNIHDV